MPTSAQVGGTSVVAIAPPAQACCPKQTLPQFLGLTGLCEGIHGIIGRIRNRLGAIWPGLEAKPEVLAISDPANLESPNPAVAEAAKVKADEDAAAQKAKAIAYLASVGCGGCYPDVEKSLLSALDDCTEEVRFAAVSALRSTAGEPCRKCRTSACCSQPVREKLEKLAYEQDDNGCYLESSSRVRRVARLALCSCTSVPLKSNGPSDRPQEGPAGEPAPAVAAEQAPRIATPSIVAAPAPGNAPSLAPQSAGQAAVGAGLAVNSNTVANVGQPANRSAERPVSFEEVLGTYQRNTIRKESQPMEVTWEHWTARREQFHSPQDAAAAMTVARAQALSREGEVIVPQLRKAAYDWTAPEQTGSPAIASALATLPIGGVSGIIEDQRGLHLVRVTSRRAAMPTPAAGQYPAGNLTNPSPAPAAAPAPQNILLQMPPCNCDK